MFKNILFIKKFSKIKNFRLYNANMNKRLRIKLSLGKFFYKGVPTIFNLIKI